jgi:hypothetical protein
LSLRVLVIQIAAGVVVAILSGSGGYLIRKSLVKETKVLPEAPNLIEETSSYVHLNGNWHFYWISYQSSNNTEPHWFHGTQIFQISKNRVEGLGVHDDDRHYKLQGEIRNGRMITTDTSLEDETDFATVFYPNLRSNTCLVGIWTGFDHLLRPISAPVILCKKEMSKDELNSALKDSILMLVSIDKL